jgi:hypothetical protein
MLWRRMGGVYVWIHVFLTSALVGGTPLSIYPWGVPGTYWIGEWLIPELVWRYWEGPISVPAVYCCILCFQLNYWTQHPFQHPLTANCRTIKRRMQQVDDLCSFKLFLERCEVLCGNHSEGYITLLPIPDCVLHRIVVMVYLASSLYSGHVSKMRASFS